MTNRPKAQDNGDTASLEAILNTAPNAIVIVDNDNIISVSNKGVAEYFGLPPEDVIGSTHDDFNERIKNLFEHPTQFIDYLNSRKKLPTAESPLDITKIISRLRSFARLDEADLKRADIHEGLEDTLTLIHHEIKHNIKIIRNYGDIPQVFCFPGRLNQVFLNLFINSKQAIKGTGEITLPTYLKDDHLFIELSDNGIGIDKDKLKRIFDPGYTTKGVGVGTGLGLSICYQIMQDHRGQIEVESTLGKGTRFTLVIPTDLERIEHGLVVSLKPPSVSDK